MVVLIIWSWIIFFGIGVVTALAESLASLDPSSIPFPTVWQPKMYPDIIKCSPGSETVWVENYIKGMVYVYKISVVFRLLFLNSLIWRSDTGMLEWIRSLLLSLPTALREHWQGNTDGGSCILSLWCSYSAVDSGGIITIHRNFRVGALFLELKSSVWHKSLILKKWVFSVDISCAFPEKIHWKLMHILTFVFLSVSFSLFVFYSKRFVLIVLEIFVLAQ